MVLLQETPVHRVLRGKQTMSTYVKRVLVSMAAVESLKKMGGLNPLTARRVLADPESAFKLIEQASSFSNLFRTPFEKPSPDVDGPFRIGFTEMKKPAGLYPYECHCLICGQTGTGKTTLLIILFSQALRFSPELPERIRSWFFSKSLELRSMIRLDSNMLVVNFNRSTSLKLNPLEPPVGTRSDEWASVFVDLWQAFRIWEGTKGFLLDTLMELYEKFSNENRYPSLYDLYAYVKAFPGKSQRVLAYKDGILTRLGALLKGPLGDVFDCSQGHSKHLPDMNVIFEILYLNQEQQIFITNYLITYLFYYKMVNRVTFRNWIALDDANSIFQALYENRVDLGLPIIHHLLTTVRKNKINIFACSQTPHQLGASIHSNSFAKIMLSLSNGKDIDFMLQSMGIKDKEQKAYCYRLKPREAVVKFSSRWQDPFLLTIPEVNYEIHR